MLFGGRSLKIDKYHCAHWKALRAYWQVARALQAPGEVQRYGGDPARIFVGGHSCLAVKLRPKYPTVAA